MRTNLRLMIHLLIWIYLSVAVSIADEKIANKIIPNLIIEEIHPDVFLHKSYHQVPGFGLVSANGLVIIENKKAYIIDTPWTEKDTAGLVSWISNQGYELVASLSTHSHDDRTGGIKWLNSHSVVTYASQLTNQLLKKENKELATQSFTGSLFVLKEGLIEVYYPGGGHTIDNLVVWLPQSKIVFGGCLVRSTDAKTLGYTGEAALDEWSTSIQNVISKYPQIEVVVPGHGSISGINALIHTKQLADYANEK